jgi:carbon-monoxide dehydrogenase medium subunit
VISDIRIAFGPSGPIPTRAMQVEDVFRGNELNEETIARAKTTILESVKFRTSRMRATAEYRYHLAQALLEKVVKIAWLRAGEKE